MALSLAVHVVVAVYLWKARFELRYESYADEAVTEVALLRPVPPPPPPPPPPEAEPPPPPRAPRVQPRPPKAQRAVPQVAPLPIPPVPVRIEPPRLPPLAIAPPAPAAPVPPPPPPPVITRPDWLRRPSAEDFARYYPDRAERRGVEGRAVIACAVSARGTLEACRVADESPGEAEFGAAALRMSREFRMRPMTRDGRPVAGGTVLIPIRFQLPD